LTSGSIYTIFLNVSRPMVKRSNHPVGILVCVAAFIALIAPSSTSSQNHLRILFTHDLISTLDPVTVVNADGQRAQSGGYPRLAIALKRAAAVNLVFLSHG